MKKVLITGSEGFVGKHLVKYLKNKNQLEIVGIDLRASLNEKFYQIDLLDPKQTSYVLNTEKPDYIIHLAGINKSDSFEYFYQLNLFTTINILEGIVQNNLKNAKSLFISSSAVYGQTNDKLVSEDSALNPINFYGSSKLAMEVVVRQYTKNFKLKTYIARPFNLIGPHQDNSFVIPDFIAQLLNIKYGMTDPVLNTRNLSSSRDFLDVRTAVEAYWLILNSKYRSSVYNIASGKVTKIRSILKSLIDMIEIKSPIKINEMEHMPGEITVLKGDVTKLHKLGWKNNFTLEQSLLDIILSMEENYDK